MTKRLHTQDCLEYAARTGKAFCIAECMEERSRRIWGEDRVVNAALSLDNKDWEALALMVLREYRRNPKEAVRFISAIARIQDGLRQTLQNEQNLFTATVTKSLLESLDDSI